MGSGPLPFQHWNQKLAIICFEPGIWAAMPPGGILEQIRTCSLVTGGEPLRGERSQRLLEERGLRAAGILLLIGFVGRLRTSLYFLVARSLA